MRCSAFLAVCVHLCVCVCLCGVVCVSVWCGVCVCVVCVCPAQYSRVLRPIKKRTRHTITQQCLPDGEQLVHI